MGILSRFKTLIKANANHAIEKHENPERVLNQLIADMRDQLIEAKKQVAVTIADEKRLKKQLDNHKHNAQEWEKKAMMAVRAGRDELAKEALRRKSEEEELATQFHAQWEQQHAAADKLKTTLRQLNQKIQQAERKKNMLVSKAKQVEARKHIQDTMEQLNNNDPLSRMGALEEKINKMEAEVEAQQELSNDDTSLEAQFADLDAKEDVDDALAALKASMGQTEQSFEFETQEATQHAAVPAKKVR